MYNEELKTRFIRSYTQSIKTARYATVVFNASEPYELEWGADLCTRTAEELQPVVDNIVGIRYKSQWAAISILKEYVKWCIMSSVPGARNGLDGIKIAGLDKVRKRMVSNPLHLQSYLDAVFDKESENTIDNIYRCFFWMAYSGIDEESALCIKKDDIDFSSMSIRYCGGMVPIYRDAIPAFKNAANLTSFAYKHPSYSKITQRDRVQGDSIMRGVKASVNRATLRRVISDHTEKAIKRGSTDLQLSFYRVWLSGLFYRMYEHERIGVPVDFSEAAIRYMDGRTYQSKTPFSRQNIIAKDYMDDYQRWKLAFSV